MPINCRDIEGLNNKHHRHTKGYNLSPLKIKVPRKGTSLYLIVCKKKTNFEKVSRHKE